MDPRKLLEEHGLPAADVEPVSAGTVNRVWLTGGHVVRVGPGGDHVREARLALAAREVGVRTPRPVA